MSDNQTYNLDINNEKIEYLKNIWDEICESIKIPNLDFDIMTPHYLCIEILDEFNNSSRNKSNKQYYLKRLNDYFSNDKTITGEIKNYFGILRRELQEPRDIIIKQILNNIIEFLNKGRYFDILFENIKSILLNSESIDDKQKDDIKYISKCLIVEFIFKGYHYKTIQKFIKNILSGYYIREDRILITDFPHDIKYNDYDNETFYNLVKEKILSLSIETRIEKLKDYFYNGKKDYYYIFHISGISGDKEIILNNVTFYNPKVKKYISKSYHSEDLEFLRNNGNEGFLNAIVLKNCIDKEQGKILAKDDISKAFDLLKFIKTTKAPFIIDNRKCIILNKDYEEEGYHLGMQNEYTPYDFLKIDKEFKYTNEKLENISNFIFCNKTLTDALYYYRKAIEASRYEEKILNFWISLETLFTNINLWNIIPKNKQKQKIELILEIIPKILICHHIYKYGWDIFYELDLVLRYKNSNREIIDVSDEILEGAGLFIDENIEGRMVYLYRFLDKLPIFISSIKDDIQKEYLISINDLYFNNTKAKDKLTSLYNDIKNEIIILYRIRNKIVHNAFYQSQFMEYSVNRLSFIVGILFNRIIDKKTIKQFDKKIIEHYIEYENIKNRLENDRNYTLYQYIKEHTIETEEEDDDE